MVNNTISISRSSYSNKSLWHALFYLCLIYNFHRYILKYSHGAYPKEGYQQTPLIWQAGKFILIALVLSVIYLRSRFVNRLPLGLLLIYGFLFVALIVNIGSAIIYGELLTDEIEYILFGLAVLPVSFINVEGLTELAEEIDSILNISQYIIIISNAIVIFNYLVFRTIPFHAYEGILMRFGGLWDDPNTLGILSVFLLGYAIIKKQYVFASFHVFNVLLSISLNAYILLFTLIAYFFINTNRNKLFRILLFSLFIIFIALIAIANFELILSLFEAKRESFEQHATIDLSFKWLPLLQPVQFHETWFLSLNVNYFPFSVPITIMLLYTLVRFFLIEPKSLQRLLFILFFVTNLFLPFLYMFPLNFISFLFLVLYFKKIRF